MLNMKDVADLDDLVADMPRFVAALSAFAEKLQLDLSAYHADHISLRCHQNTTAERWRKARPSPSTSSMSPAICS